MKAAGAKKKAYSYGVGSVRVARFSNVLAGVSRLAGSASGAFPRTAEQGAM